MRPVDPWTAFLTWLSTVIVPNWGQLISMLPLFLILGVVGPILSLVTFMWFWHRLHRRRGHVRVAEPDVVAALRDASGVPQFPPNTPFCEAHALIYPASRTRCEVDGDELRVSCPVDHTVRAASQQVCSVCGTRYVLAAAKTSLTVRRSGRPPEGGAAVA